MLYRPMFVTNSSSSAHLYYGVSLNREEILNTLRPHMSFGDWEEAHDEDLYDLSDQLIKKWQELTGQTEKWGLSNHTDPEDDVAFFSTSSWDAEYGISVIGKAEPKENEKVRLASFIEFACPTKKAEWALEHNHGY